MSWVHLYFLSYLDGSIKNLLLSKMVAEDQDNMNIMYPATFIIKTKLQGINSDKPGSEMNAI